MSDLTKRHFENVKAWAGQNGFLSKFEEAVDYARTWSGGNESGWKSVLSVDVPFNPEDKSFIVQIYRRAKAGGGSTEYLFHYMTLGMIFRDDEGWSFHS